MKQTLNTRLISIVLLFATFSVCTYAQGTVTDYERAGGLKTRYEAAVVDIAGAATWIGNTHRFWYRKLSRGANVYMIFNVDTSQKNAAFDHDKIAASFSKLTGNTYKAQDLQLAQLRFDNGVTSFNANVDGTAVRCTIADSVCTKTEFPTRPQGPVRSPDNKWEALTVNYNLAIRVVDAKEPIVLSTDGSEGNYYAPRSIVWSPDSTKIAVLRVRPGYKREVRYIESSPEDQIQPKFTSIVYAKPGDVLDLEQPVLFDVTTRKQINVDNALFPNPWVVRGIQRVDESKRQIWFSAGGTHAGKDPYFASYYRINFDGTSLTELTAADANHNVSYSTDFQFYVDNFSRLDLPPVLEVRKTADNSVVSTVERGDITELKKTGWQPPEVFTAKGRDGKTDIWGLIIRPTNFDPGKKYPVLENIYAGPQGSFVPKSFLTYSTMMGQAEIGFIVVQIDGMGTSNRSKAFHDVAWKNLGDAGFLDRILWHKAVAAKYPWYDVSRVGLYGGSAGGQNALGGLLFHPEFYKAAVSYAGCHDNRMDKIWWNEQWMSWPIGPQYAASSNVDNAYRLQGELLLIVGEMDTNVDPSSTMQVVHQLVKHHKNFDLLVIPGANHSAGRSDRYAAYGDHKRYDFFVRHLLGMTPPPWNQSSATNTTQSANK